MADQYCQADYKATVWSPHSVNMCQSENERGSADARADDVLVTHCCCWQIKLPASLHVPQRLRQSHRERHSEPVTGLPHRMGEARKRKQIRFVRSTNNISIWFFIDRIGVQFITGTKQHLRLDSCVDLATSHCLRISVDWRRLGRPGGDGRLRDGGADDVRCGARRGALGIGARGASDD